MDAKIILKNQLQQNQLNILKFLREQVMEKINFKKKKMILLTTHQHKSYENAKICYSCEEIFEDKYTKEKKQSTVRDHWHYTGEYRGAANICNLEYIIPKEIFIFFHNGPTMVVLS